MKGNLTNATTLDTPWLAQVIDAVAPPGVTDEIIVALIYGPGDRAKVQYPGVEGYDGKPSVMIGLQAQTKFPAELLSIIGSVEVRSLQEIAVYMLAHSFKRIEQARQLRGYDEDEAARWAAEKLAAYRNGELKLARVVDRRFS